MFPLGGIQTVDMLVRLLEQQPALNRCAYSKALTKKNLQNKLFTPTEKEACEQMVKLLLPFKLATTKLSSESLVTSSSIKPSLALFAKATEPSESDCPLITQMKALAKTDFEKRYKAFDDKLLLLASLLDPRTKGLNFVSSPEFAKAKQYLLDEAMQVATPSNPTPPIEVEDAPGAQDAQDTLDEDIHSPPAKRARRELFNSASTSSDCDLDWLNEVIEVEVRNTDEANNEVENEVERYISEPQSKIDPLQWWKERQNIFPTLSVLARKYLAFPASSVSSERIFSLAGNIVNKKRALLHHDNVDKLIFLNKNQK